MDWKEKIRDLKQQFEEFWERHLQRGAGRFSAPPPFVGILSHKLFRLVLKSRIFSLTADLIFQFFVGEAWGERRIIFWKFKENQNFVFLLCLHVCELLYIVSFVVKSPSGGKNPWKTAPANPRMSLFEKCFKSWFDTVRWWGMSYFFWFAPELLI